MAKAYGWTLPDIDALGADGRTRVRFMWAVSNVHDLATDYIGEWSKKQEALSTNISGLRGG